MTWIMLLYEGQVGFLAETFRALEVKNGPTITCQFFHGEASTKSDIERLIYLYMKKESVSLLNR